MLTRHAAGGQAGVTLQAKFITGTAIVLDPSGPLHAGRRAVELAAERQAAGNARHTAQPPPNFI